MFDGGVVNKYVDLTERIEGLGDQRVHRVGIDNVGRNGKRVPTGVGEAVRDILQPVGGPGCHRYVPASPCEDGSRPRAQPAAGPRDDRYLLPIRSSILVECLANDLLVGLHVVPGGLGMPIQLPGVQRPPTTVVHRLTDVGDQDMAVQQRIPGPRRAMPEPRSHEAADPHPLTPIHPTPRPTRLPLQIPNRRRDSTVMRIADRPRRRGVSDAVQDADRLRRTKRQIEPWHPPMPRTRQPLPRRRVGRA